MWEAVPYCECSHVLWEEFVAGGRIPGRYWEKKSYEVSYLLFTVTSTNRYYPPSPPSKNGLKLVCWVNIVYGNLKSENSQDYAQKPEILRS
jgi:hypothetical protein